MSLSSSTLVRHFHSSFTRELIGRFTLPLVTGVETKSTYKCEECPDEPVTTETETSYQVSCFIAQDVKYMHTAIRKVSNGTVEPPNKGHYGAKDFVPCREVVPISEVK